MKRTTPLKRQTRMRPGRCRSFNSTLRTRSPKAQKLAPIRRDFVRVMLSTHPVCQVQWDEGCQGRSVDVHEPKTRARGGSILSVRNAVATCRPCHDAIHANPLEAHARGFLKSRWPDRKDEE